MGNKIRVSEYSLGEAEWLSIRVSFGHCTHVRTHHPQHASLHNGRFERWQIGLGHVPQRNIRIEAKTIVAVRIFQRVGSEMFYGGQELHKPTKVIPVCVILIRTCIIIIVIVIIHLRGVLCRPLKTTHHGGAELTGE